MSPSKVWAHGEPNTIAEIFNEKEIKKYLSTNPIVGPDEVMVLIEDGQIVNTYTQTKVENLFGTLSDRMKKKITGKGKVIEILMADISEKKIFLHFGNEYPVKPSTADNDVVDGNLSILFSIDRHNIANLYSQVVNKPDKVLTTRDIRVLLQNDVLSRVLVPTIKGFSTEEIGGTDTIKRIENESLKEVGRIMDLYSIEPIRFTVSFDLTAMDELKMETRKKELSAKMETGAYEKEAMKIDEVEEIEEWRKGQIAEREKGRILRDLDIEKTAIARDHEKVIHEMDLRSMEEERTYEHIVGLEKRKEKDRMEIEGEITAADLDLKKKITEAEIEREMKLAQTKHDIREKDFEQDILEMQGMMQIKSQKDKLKMDHMELESKLKINEYQGTTLKEREIELEKTKAVASSDAEKAKYNLDVYERALDRSDKRHDKDLSHIANILGASRQNVPHTLVQGAKETGTTINTTENARKLECLQCGAFIEEGIRICSNCGAQVQ